MRRLLSILALCGLGAVPADTHEPICKRPGIRPVQLRCEYAVNPVGIDAAQPRFSWVLQSSRRGQVQSACQILVAGTEERLRADTGDKWDSGKIDSDRSVNVAYEGSPLASGEKCWWKVRAWGKDGRASEYSKPATFEMGLLKQSDWQGKWIRAGKEISSPLLRKEFEITRKISAARAYFSGLGWGELYINGKKVSDDVLSPTFTDYFKEIKYRTCDVTGFLKQGPNAIGIMLGNGWFATPQVLSWEKGGPWGRQPQAILQVTVTYDDGTRQLLFTDDSWKAAAGPIGHNYGSFE